MRNSAKISSKLTDEDNQLVVCGALNHSVNNSDLSKKRQNKFFTKVI